MSSPALHHARPGRPGIDLPLSFDRLINRFRVTGQLEAVSGFRVGAGKSLDAAATDQPVMRDALGQPFIPGSSVKGALRSSLEAILHGLDRQDLKACDIFAARCVGDSAEDKGRSDGGQPIPFGDVLKRSCTACNLFGSSFIAGRVFIHDLPCCKPDAATEVRDGVGIHRDLGTAQQGIKYDVEVVPAGTRFELEILLENVYDFQLALLLQCLDMLHRGEILIGGLTSRGLGKVRLVEPALQYIDAPRLLTGQGFETLSFDGATRAGGELLTALLTEVED